jgi:hypothetical protein
MQRNHAGLGSGALLTALFHAAQWSRPVAQRTGSAALVNPCGRAVVGHNRKATPSLVTHPLRLPPILPLRLMVLTGRGV